MGKLTRAAAVLGLFWAGAAQAAYEITGKVSDISDGDTFTMISNEGVPYKIRLLHIDSPERGKPYYKKAKQALETLISRQTVRGDCTWLDSFNRHLCVIYVGDFDVNRAMLEQGAAWLHPKYYDYDKDPAELLPVQNKARQGKVGLWGMGEYSRRAPWD
mgnify:CR=1 FL=1